MVKIIYRVLLSGLLTIFSFSFLQAQSVLDTLPIMDYANAAEFEIGGIDVEGANFSDENAIISISGLKIGDKVRIPGPDVPRAINSLMALKLFTNVELIKEKTLGEVIFLKIRVEERPRLTTHSFTGVKKGSHDDLNDEVNKYLVKGGIVTENIKASAATAIRKYWVEKGFLDTKIAVYEKLDTVRLNSVKLEFNINKGNKIKIHDIIFVGNSSVSSKKLRRKMKETKEQRRLFAASKFLEKEYKEDKKKVVAYYNTMGYRDARVINDSLWRDEKGKLNIQINMVEGSQYYFRNIVWKGNSIYDNKTLSNVLGITKGEVFNQELLESRLSFSQDGRDVSSLYLDDGYLFFRADPIETSITTDSIDLEIRIYEGPQATIDKVTIAGNDRTHEHVIRRELRTLPGAKFSRSDIIRSQRELINLGYFNPENLGINTPVNPARGTVDIEYTVEEKPSDQLELSAGWGGVGRGVIGTLGVSFNNFSLRNIKDRSTWSPLPQGDGQRLSLRAQTNGRFFQSYNFSFTEPWLGGKKPTSLTTSAFYNILTNGFDKDNASYGRFGILGITASVGTRLKWPDDNFISSTAVSLQFLDLNNYTEIFRLENGSSVRTGNFKNFSIEQTITRTTINNPLFPQEGSKFSLSLQVTPPYSLFSKKDYKEASIADRYRWIEYHKWKFDAEWYTTIVGKLVLKTAAKVGMMGAFNEDIGITPFERFQLGGDGLSNQNLGFFNGTEIISMRGYEVNDFAANRLSNGAQIATPIMSKYTVELRYPLSLNPNSTIYGLVFAQGGNAWRNFRAYDPFDLQRSAGVGLRVFLPMFGMLGFDYGLGFDKPGERTLSNYGNFNIILGFEPE